MKESKKKRVRNAALPGKKAVCRHDYKNAIRVGHVDYVCPLCKESLDSFEWFLMNSFEFVDATPKKGERL